VAEAVSHIPEGLSVLVVGAGMYVRGDSKGYHGTIGPALLEGVRKGLVQRICVVTTSKETAEYAVRALRALADDMGLTGVALQALEPSDDLGKLAADTGCQAACVSVPDHLHEDICVDLAEAGVHILVVKPMASSLAGALRMYAAAKTAGVVAQVEFHKRLDESNLVLFSEIRKGSLGKLQYATVTYSQQKRIPEHEFRSWSNKSNIFQYLGVHYVDLLYWATGFKPMAVTAWGQKDYLVSRGIDTWDSMQVVVEWLRPDGGCFVSTHMSNWIDPDVSSAVSDQKISVVGSSGRLDLDQKHRGVQLLTDGVPVRDLNPYFTQGLYSQDGGSLRFSGYGIRSILQFLQQACHAQGAAKGVLDCDVQCTDFREGVISTAVIDAARKSLQSDSRKVMVALAEDILES
jgi:predicted dehydrogenase